MRTEISAGIQVALRGLSDRQRTISNNVSNIETPSFLAKRTDFESSLRKAMNSTADVNVSPKHTVSTDETRTNGNNVNLDNETVSAVETQLRYQSMVEAMNNQFRILRTSMG